MNNERAIRNEAKVVARRRCCAVPCRVMSCRVGTKVNHRRPGDIIRERLPWLGPRNERGITEPTLEKETSGRRERYLKHPLPAIVRERQSRRVCSAPAPFRHRFQWGIMELPARECEPASSCRFRRFLVFANRGSTRGEGGGGGVWGDGACDFVSVASFGGAM